jgi:hypothetical protein
MRYHLSKVNNCISNILQASMLNAGVPGCHFEAGKSLVHMAFIYNRDDLLGQLTQCEQQYQQRRDIVAINDMPRVCNNLQEYNNKYKCCSAVHHTHREWNNDRNTINNDES